MSQTANESCHKYTMNHVTENIAAAGLCLWRRGEYWKLLRTYDELPLERRKAPEHTYPHHLCFCCNCCWAAKTRMMPYHFRSFGAKKLLNIVVHTNIYQYVYKYVYVCTYVCIYVYVCVHMYVHRFIYIYLSLHIYVYIHICIYT